MEQQFCCEYCKKPLVFSEGQWKNAADPAAELAQYCWVDPEYGSQLHYPIYAEGQKK